MSVGETVATWPLFPDKIALINLIHSDIRGNQEVLPFLFPRVAQKKGFIQSKVPNPKLFGLLSHICRLLSVIWIIQRLTFCSSSTQPVEVCHYQQETHGFLLAQKKSLVMFLFTALWQCFSYNCRDSCKRKGVSWTVVCLNTTFWSGTSFEVSWRALESWGRSRWERGWASLLGSAHARLHTQPRLSPFSTSKV